MRHFYIYQREGIAPALFCWITFCGGLCAGQVRSSETQTEIKGNKEGQAVCLEVKVVSGPEPHSQKIVYKSPYKWHTETHIAGTVRHYICNGKVAWSYIVTDGQLSEIRKWDVLKLVEKHGKETIYDALLTEALDGISAIANPTIPPWKNEFASMPVVKEISFIREEKLEKIPVMRYTLGIQCSPVSFHIWFGKKDGLMRKQVLYKGKDEWMRWTVEKIDTESAIPEEMFRFDPPKGANVIEETNQLMEQVEAQNKKRK